VPLQQLVKQHPVTLTLSANVLLRSEKIPLSIKSLSSFLNDVVQLSYAAHLLRLASADIEVPGVCTSKRKGVLKATSCTYAPGELIFENAIVCEWNCDPL
jgi:hypothetical protein